ncbi:MAG: radical SAM protein [Chloroflexota bacterium]|jgi:wyosine [tRNA(Phe)-imidazoG37] synthetase (radical SAM superfamily)
MPPVPIVFGPVLSRRLGWSLGVNHLRPKTCSYSCVYCQAGATTRARTQPEHHYDPDDVAAAVLQRVARCRASHQPLDVVTFVPDGEPTLDRGLREVMEVLRADGLRVAVISNGSLLPRAEVRETLALADVVSLKVDTVRRSTWQRLNRPVGTLDLDRILRSMRVFAAGFRGQLLTETMLVAGVNDDAAAVERVADVLASIHPRCAYIAVPTRPGTEPWVRPPHEAVTRRATGIFASRGLRVGLLTDEDDAGIFAPGPDAVEGLLGILAVHPMSESMARDYTDAAAGDWATVERLIDRGRIARISRDGTAFLRIDHAHDSARS